MGYGVAASVLFSATVVHYIGSMYVRPGMFKSNRPQLMRDVFTMSAKAEYPNPMASLYSYYTWDYVRTSLGSGFLLGVLSRPQHLGPALALLLYGVGGVCGGFAWMVQRRFKPSAVDSAWDRAVLAAAATGALAGAAAAFPAARLLPSSSLTLGPFAALWTAEAAAEEYVAGLSGDPQNGAIRQHGLAGGLLLGLTVATFLRSRASGLALIRRLQMPASKQQ